MGLVVGISDGDIIRMLHHRCAEKVRLHGIDAPEKGQPFTNRAKQFTSSLAFGQEVTVESGGQDRYGRTIGEVILSDASERGVEQIGGILPGLRSVLPAVKARISTEVRRVTLARR